MYVPMQVSMSALPFIGLDMTKRDKLRAEVLFRLTNKTFRGSKGAFLLPREGM